MIKLRNIISEAFELPPEIDDQSEKLAKFIASLFLKYFKTKISNVKTKTDPNIVKYNEYYRLAKQYKDEGNQIFSIKKNIVDTKWGNSDIRVFSKDKSLPDVVLKIADGYVSSNDGYVKDIENPKEIFILVNKQHFIKSFKQSTEELIDTVKHEIRHWHQLTDVIGLPKTKILNKKVDILGKALKPNFFGYVPQEQHHLRDIEFKTNVHTYAFYLKRYMNKWYAKSDWKSAFKRLVSGNWGSTTSDDMMNNIINNLEHMMTKDQPRWRQFIKELYKLIFKND
jgi:hypothetical protein